MTDVTDTMATDDSDVSNDGLGVLEAQAQAFSELGRTLTEAVEQALRQATEITSRAQEHAIAVVTRADHRVAEGLRQATVAERRAAAAQTRLIDLEDRIDQAQAKLGEIGAHATEIARMVSAFESPAPASARPAYTWDQQHDSAADTSHHQEALPGQNVDPFAALASLRDTVDAAG